MSAARATAASSLGCALLACALGWFACTPAARENPNAPAPLFVSALGGSSREQARDVAVDRDGNIVIVGGTRSQDFPRTVGPPHAGVQDVFVSVFTPRGELVWSRLLGGPAYDRAYSVEVAPDGSILVGGRAGPGYPTTEGSLQPEFGGDLEPTVYQQQDGFVTSLSPDGSEILWSTFFGSDDAGFLRDFDVDDQGRVVVAMTFGSRPIAHITPGAFQTAMPRGSFGVIARISADGARLEWGTYLGGDEDDTFALGVPSVRAAADGHVIVAASTGTTSMPITPGAFQPEYGGGKVDLYVAKLAPDGGSLVYATYLGGSEVEFGDTHNLALDAAGRAVVAATTRSEDFPTTPGVLQRQYGGSGGKYNQTGDAFVSVLAADGRSLVASTYVGGSSGEGLEGVAVDSQGRIVISGGTWSDDFPLPPDAWQALPAGRADGFALRLSPALDRILSGTRLGGSHVDHVLSAAALPDGSIALAGETHSEDLRTLNAFQSEIVDGKAALIAVLPP